MLDSKRLKELMEKERYKELARQNNKENPQSVSDKESRKTDTAFAQDMLMGVGITAIFAFIAFSVIMWVGRFAKNTELMMDGMTGAYIALIAVMIIMAVSIRLDKVIPNKDDKMSTMVSTSNYKKDLSYTAIPGSNGTM